MSHDPVIEPAAVSSLGAYRLLDVRAPDAFDAGHPAQTVRVPIEVWEAAARAGETSFENVAYWERQIAGIGVDGQVPAVIYDDGRMTEAARVWFILQYFGAKAFILNGGWPAIEGGGPLPGWAAKPGDSTTFRARPGAAPSGSRTGRHSRRSSALTFASSMPAQPANTRERICGAMHAAAICRARGWSPIPTCSTTAA